MRFFAVFISLVGFGAFTHANEDGNIRKRNLETCTTTLKYFRVWEEGSATPKTITNNLDVCVQQGRRITYDAWYGDCLSDDFNPIRDVELSHFFNNVWQSEKTEKEPLYFLYGNVGDRITYGNPLIGSNKLTAEANDEGPTVEVPFTLSYCV